MKALTGGYRAERLFALEQALAFRTPTTRKHLSATPRIEAVLKARRNRTDQANALAYERPRGAVPLVGKDITTLDGLGPYLSLKLIAEWGDDLSSWRSAKHCTSWLDWRRTTRSPAAECSRPNARIRR
ncbi:hypothetical protein [Bradyrhizobium sp. 153]|uniref:hypothetical protein n=1 Tax=Bradyrhizobium sp. 153 TaxID=2782627 RepID=UPI001FF95302|nr:hypothetical protein [Bradyrhizobium sp. 153]MCK1666371.1 hypothetical protein [Bradyrhizobium sp. 153]